MAIMDDFVKNIYRRTMVSQGKPDSFNGSLDSGAKATRLGENYRQIYIFFLHLAEPASHVMDLPFPATCSGR
jgi:hypothetical protein